MLTLYMGNRLRAGRWLLLAMLGLLHGATLISNQAGKVCFELRDIP